jgi:single-stranded-DNA-specific exonuclease
VLTLADLSETTVRDVYRLAPFGFGNPAPLFAVRDVEIAGANSRPERRVVNVGLKQNGRTVIVTAWDWHDRMDELRPGTRADVALCLEDRGRNGEWRATLKDVQPL